MKKYILGAYVTAPTLFEWDERKADAYWDAVAELDGVAGYEHDYWGSLHRFDDEWFLRRARSDLDYVFTCVPGNMTRLADEPTFGLASSDESGRAAALSYTRGAHTAVRRLNERLGKQAVTHVQLHSAPRSQDRPLGNQQAFERSLLEVVGWDWEGARITIEHCDAAGPAHPPEKGFLSLEAEIAAVQAVNAQTDQRVGVTINWGRSAIEGRSGKTPAEHVRRAREAELLAGLMFSGCSDREGPYGVWKDTHMPVAPAAGLEYPADGSLMDARSIEECLAAAGNDLDYLGLKIMALPQPDELPRRIGVNRDCMRLLDQLLRAGAVS